MKKNSRTDPVSQLCPNCGLCCNGVLFADVELQKGDDARQLAGLGLSLKKKGCQRAFAQPCACFADPICRIYPDRPAYCRAFECGLLKAVQAGEREAKTALTTIAGAKRRVDKVYEILRWFGQNEESTALMERYSQVMREPVDLSGPEDAVAMRGKLMHAMEDLMRLLQRDFLR